MILIKAVYSDFNPTIKVAYDVTNVNVVDTSSSPIYVNMSYDDSGVNPYTSGLIKVAYNESTPSIKVAYEVTDITISGGESSPVYVSLDYSASGAATNITSVGLTMPTGFIVSNSPLVVSGTIGVGFDAGYSLPSDAEQATWDTAYNRSLTAASVSGTTTKTLTLTKQDGSTLQTSWNDYDTGLTSVGLSMPAAFTVSNTPLTSNGTLAVAAAGSASQYIRGDGQLADFPSGGSGGGASVSYYLNGSVSQGTFGGNTYYEMNKNPIVGSGTDFNISGDGYIAQFITDAADPSSLLIPGGNWNFEMYFSASSNGGTPNFHLELYKYDGTTFTQIANNSSSPELIAFGTTINAYFAPLAVPETVLGVNDRLGLRVYVKHSGRTITLHTEDNHLCQVITTFTTGLTALNGLTKQVQYFATGTSGNDFGISSVTDTHTFNLPTASSTKRGALSSADWSTFSAKLDANSLIDCGTW